MAAVFIEKITKSISEMNRRQVKAAILHFRGRVKLDFSEEYLNALPLDRLRHILLAAHLHKKRSN